MRIALVALMALLSGCSRNVDDAKACAPAAFKQAGFDVIGYHGYQLSAIYGGFVWYSLDRIPSNGIIYEGAAATWFDECHLYSIKALDAIKP
jgi:hypothetical protein